MKYRDKIKRLICTIWLQFTIIKCLYTAKRPRPRVTTPEEDEGIIEVADGEEPLTNAVSLKERLHLNVTMTTIRRRLHAADIHCRIPAKKEKFTDAHRVGRLEFARLHQHRGLDFWSRAVFVDEKTFHSSDHGRIHVWRRDNTR